MSKPNIVRGITFVDPERHVAIANYRPHAPENEGVNVIEMANAVAQHLGNLTLVFARRISYEELIQRKSAYEYNPDQYAVDHLKSLSK